jgi:hypothetical protein
MKFSLSFLVEVPVQILIEIHLTILSTGNVGRLPVMEQRAHISLGSSQ